MAGEAKPAPISVVLVDDHPVVRVALRSLLADRPGIEVVGEAGDLGGARESLGRLAPDVLVLDVNLPDGLAVEVLPELRELSPRTAIVLLTMDREPALARRALAAGAHGYLFKDAAHPELLDALRAVAAGRRYLSAALAAAPPGSAPPPGSLSPRETDVLRLMALGHTNREIGERLGVGVRTVETHRSHIQRKLGLASRPELTRYALDAGLLDA